MILAIELADRVAGRGVVVAIVLAGLRLRLGIHRVGDERLPGFAGDRQRAWSGGSVAHAIDASYSSSSRIFASTL